MAEDETVHPGTEERGAGGEQDAGDPRPMIGATLGAVAGVAAALLTTELWPTTVIVALFFVATSSSRTTSSPRASCGTRSA